MCDVPIALRSSGAPILHEPPCCTQCSQVARLACPGIAKLLTRRGVIVARVRRSEPMAAAVGPALSGSEDLNALLGAWKGAPPIGYVRTALLDWTPIDPTSMRSDDPAKIAKVGANVATTCPRATPEVAASATTYPARSAAEGSAAFGQNGPLSVPPTHNARPCGGTRVEVTL